LFVKIEQFRGVAQEIPQNLIARRLRVTASTGGDDTAFYVVDKGSSSADSSLSLPIASTSRHHPLSLRCHRGDDITGKVVATRKSFSQA
jgi:hypothetical protein